MKARTDPYVEDMIVSRLEPPPGKSQLAICFRSNTGTDTIEKQMDPSDRIASRDRSVRLSVNL